MRSPPRRGGIRREIIAPVPEAHHAAARRLHPHAAAHADAARATVALVHAGDLILMLLAAVATPRHFLERHGAFPRLAQAEVADLRRGHLLQPIRRDLG